MDLGYLLRLAVHWGMQTSNIPLYVIILLQVVNFSSYHLYQVTIAIHQSLQSIPFAIHLCNLISALLQCGLLGICLWNIFSKNPIKSPSFEGKEWKGSQKSIIVLQKTGAWQNRAERLERKREDATETWSKKRGWDKRRVWPRVRRYEAARASHTRPWASKKHV